MPTNAYAQFLDVKNKRFQYGSDLSIYTERFIDGRLLCAGYQDNGVVIYEHHEFVDKPAFDLVIDGESLYYGWNFVDFVAAKGERGSSNGTLTLRHSRKPVEIKIITSSCGFGFFKRAMEITNLSNEAALGITSIAPFKGCLWSMTDSLAENLQDATVAPYSVGRFKDLYWSNEGNFDWQDISLNTGIFFHSTFGISGHSSPFFVLRNNIYGGYFVCQMGWSSNWKTSFYADYNNDRHAHDSKVHLNFEVMPVSSSPARMLAPGETITSPEVHFGLSHKDFDTAIQNLHAYQRQFVLKVAGEGLQPVIYNQAGYMQPSYKQPDMSVAGLKQEIDIAAEIGAELFMVDAGWYGKNGHKETDWGNTTGDWHAADFFPEDLFPVYAYAREKGLKCGLWVEIETAGSKSKLAAEHPDWFLTRFGKTIDRMLDLAKPQVQDFVESEIIRLVERYQLDMFRLDYNSGSYEGGFNEQNGRLENTHWKHVQAVYDIFDRVGKRFPQLQLENCASGGGRTDVGIVSRFTTTWVSDWFKMPRTVKILNGMSMALPPEYVNRSTGVCMESSYHGSADTQMHVVLMAHPTLFGITPSLAEANPAILACTKKYVSIYKEFIRPFHRTAKVYHHNPVIPGADGSGWCALEYVSEDQTKAIAAVFRLMHAEESVYILKLKGLKKGANYQIKIEPDGSQFAIDGYTLSRDGLRIELDSALTSQLILLTEKE